LPSLTWTKKHPEEEKKVFEKKKLFLKFFPKMVSGDRQEQISMVRLGLFG
jgi:hypothetical protein